MKNKLWAGFLHCFISLAAQAQFYIPDGTRIFVTAADELTTTGDLSNSGSIDRITLGGAAAQSISGTGNITYLKLDKSSGTATITGGMQRVAGTLTLTAGTLAVGGTTSPYAAGRLTLASGATGTARIPAHTDGGSGTGSVTGHVIVERYFSVDGRNKQWRGLGFPFAADMEVSAVGGIAVDFNSGTRSMMYYNEQADNGSYGNTGTRNAGYQSFTAATETLTAGKGAMAWIYGNASTAGPANGTGSMSGNVTVTSFGALNESGTAVSMPVTFNSTPLDPNFRGWNLLSNPYASSIDWSHGDIIKTNIDNAIYRWDPAAANWTSWNAGTGTPDASITPIIESGNSFFVKANAASPVLTIPQTAKTETAPGFVHFGRAPRLNLPGERAPRTYTFAGIRLLVKGQGNPLPDGAYVDVSRPEATAHFDGALDAESMGRSSGAGIAVKDESGNAYAIQFDRPILGAGTEKRYYPLRLTTPVPGSTTLTLQTEGVWNPSNSVALLDNKEGKTYLMTGGQLEHSFTLNELKSEGRFVLAINHVKLSADGQLPVFEVKALGNPVTSSVIELLISHPSATAKHWRVVDAAGREVGNGSFQADAGLQHRLTVPGMRNVGTYVVQVEMDNGETQQVRILKN